MAHANMRSRPFLRDSAARLAVAFALSLALPSLAFADFAGRVERVADGDTLTVVRDGRPVRVRLDGIDAPELKQAYGGTAKLYVEDAVKGRDVLVIERGSDRYGRTVGEIRFAGESLNRLVLRDGFAWWYRRYSKDASLGALEADARGRRAGLWADDDPVPPWEYRRQNRGLTPDHRALLRLFDPGMSPKATKKAVSGT